MTYVPADPLRPADTDRDPDRPLRDGAGCGLAAVVGFVFWLAVVSFVIGVMVGRVTAPGSSPQATPAAVPPNVASETPAGSSSVPSLAGSVLGRTSAPTRKPTPRPTIQARHGRLIVRGVATMTDTRCAAAGPKLRHALGAHWRGTEVRIWFGGDFGDTWLCDWCACRDRPGGPTVIDLPPSMFAAFGQSPGVLRGIRVERIP